MLARPSRRHAKRPRLAHRRADAGPELVEAGAAAAFPRHAAAPDSPRAPSRHRRGTRRDPLPNRSSARRFFEKRFRMVSKEIRQRHDTNHASVRGMHRQARDIVLAKQTRQFPQASVHADRDRLRRHHLAQGATRDGSPRSMARRGPSRSGRLALSHLRAPRASGAPRLAAHRLAARFRRTLPRGARGRLAAMTPMRRHARVSPAA